MFGDVGILRHFRERLCSTQDWQRRCLALSARLLRPSPFDAEHWTQRCSRPGNGNFPKMLACPVAPCSSNIRVCRSAHLVLPSTVSSDPARDLVQRCW